MGRTSDRSSRRGQANAAERLLDCSHALANRLPVVTQDDDYDGIPALLSFASDCPGPYAARRRTSQTVAATRSRESARSQPPSIHWNGQNRPAGWYVVNCV